MLKTVGTDDELLRVRELLLEDEFGNLGLLYALDEADEHLRVYVDDPSKPRLVIIFRLYWYLGYASNVEESRDYIRGFMPNEETDWAGVEEKMAMAIREGRTVRWETPCQLYYLPKDRFRKAQEHDVEPLRESDAELVLKHWPYGDPDDLHYVRERIRNGPSVAIYEDGKAVAWALTHLDGSMGMFHVLEEYRRRGYGSSINSALTELIISQGRTPFCHIADGNVASISLVEKAGLLLRGHYYYFGVE